jgi:hypothetical protein
MLMLDYRGDRRELCLAEVTFATVKLVLINLAILETLLASDAFYLEQLKKPFDGTMHLLEVRVGHLALRALFAMCTLIVFNAFSAKITLASLCCAEKPFSHNVVTLVALKLFGYFFDATKVGNPTLSEMIGFALSSISEVHLIATMIFDQISFCCLESTELALKLVHFALLQVMIMHMLFNDAITVTLDATTAFIFMLFKLIIEQLILASHGSETAIELDGLQKSKKLLIVCEGTHFRLLGVAARASVLTSKPLNNAFFAEHRFLTLYAILRISGHESKVLADHAVCEVLVLFDFIVISNQLFIGKLFYHFCFSYRHVNCGSARFLLTLFSVTAHSVRGSPTHIWTVNFRLVTIIPAINSCGIIDLLS